MERFIKFIGYHYAVMIINEHIPSLIQYRLYKYYLYRNGSKVHKSKVCIMKTVDLDEWNFYIRKVVRSYWLSIVILLGLINLSIYIISSNIFLTLASVPVLYVQWKIVIRGLKGNYIKVPNFLMRRLLRKRFKDDYAI